MKAFALVVSFVTGQAVWPWLRVDRPDATPKTPEPPIADDEPDERKHEYPFWTYFTENRRPKS